MLKINKYENDSNICLVISVQDNQKYVTLQKHDKSEKRYGEQIKLRMRDSYTNPYETKRIESFEIFGLTNRIHETGI